MSFVRVACFCVDDVCVRLNNESQWRLGIFSLVENVVGQLCIEMNLNLSCLSTDGNIKLQNCCKLGVTACKFLFQSCLNRKGEFMIA